MASYEELQETGIMGQVDKARELTTDLLDSSVSPMEIISEGLNRGLSVVGQRFQSGEMFLPEMLASARAVSGAMELLKL